MENNVIFESREALEALLDARNFAAANAAVKDLMPADAAALLEELSEHGQSSSACCPKSWRRTLLPICPPSLRSCWCGPLATGSWKR